MTRGMRRLQKWARRITPCALVLLYHRVADADQDPQLLCVTPQHFAEHLQVLHQYYHPMSLRELHRGLALGKRTPRSVALTFDDGYADNLYQAFPLLEAAQVPAVVFVTTEAIDSGRAFWWDELEHVFLSSPNLPDRLTLTISGRTHTWDLGKAEKDYHAGGTWHILMDTVSTPRQAAYKQLAGLLQGQEGSTREAILDELSAWSGMERKGQADQRALTGEELRRLGQGGLIEIGAHTVNHSVLSALPAQTQRKEIAESKKTLENILCRPVVGFSYPFGGRGDYTVETVRMVKEAGFDYACSVFQRTVRRRSDPYQLPRFLVRDWDGEEFNRRLEGWFDS